MIETGVRKCRPKLENNWRGGGEGDDRNCVTRCSVFYNARDRDARVIRASCGRATDVGRGNARTPSLECHRRVHRNNNDCPQWEKNSCDSRAAARQRLPSSFCVITKFECGSSAAALFPIETILGKDSSYRRRGKKEQKSRYSSTLRSLTRPNNCTRRNWHASNLRCESSTR